MPGSPGSLLKPIMWPCYLEQLPPCWPTVTSLVMTKFPPPSHGRPWAAPPGLSQVGSYLTLALQLLGGPANDVDVRGWEADGAVHRDVLGGPVRCVDLHVQLGGQKTTRSQHMGTPCCSAGWAFQ